MKKYCVAFLIFLFFNLHAAWTLKYAPNCTYDMNSHTFSDGTVVWYDDSRICYWAWNDTDPDGDGFWSDYEQPGAAELYNCKYCPAVDPELGVRLIDELNKEDVNCEIYEYLDGSVYKGFKYSHIRTYAQNNPNSSTWVKYSNPGMEENSNYFDDNCDGYVNEFTFQYFENDAGNYRQTGQSEFVVTLNVNEPVIYGSNVFDIKFEVFKIEQLPSYCIQYPEQYDPSSVATPVETHSVAYTGGSVVQTTITVPDNKDQVYVVKAHLMTRDTTPKEVIGFDSNGYYVVPPYTVLQRDRLKSDNYYIMLSRYENGYPVSKKRADIVNLALFYKYMSDVGFIGRQNNYDSVNDEGYYVPFETGTYFSNRRQIPWCSEFVSGVYLGVDENALIYDYDYLLVNNESDYYNSKDYISISIGTMADWFNQVHTGANNELKKANLLPLTSINYASKYVPTAYMTNPSMFSLETAQAGDYLSLYHLDHSAMFLGYSSNTDKIFTIEGNQNGNTATLMVRDRNLVGFHNDRINNMGKLPY